MIPPGTGELKTSDIVSHPQFEGYNPHRRWFLVSNFCTTFDALFIGCRVCVVGRPKICGEVVRLIPMTGRVVVRLDPAHPSWRGTLRSFRPERLLIYSDDEPAHSIVT
jgi:hypothetical protein